MGQNKALMLFNGLPLIERVVRRLQSLADEVLVSTNQPEDYAFLGLPLYPDLIPGKGPLGGLYTALKVARGELVALVACDMPFASPLLLAAERELLLAGSWDVVIPRSSEGLEPLHAIYRVTTCLPAVERALQKERLRMVSWLVDVKVRQLSAEEVRAVDPDLRAFMNVNTPDEFRQAELLDEPPG